MISLGMIVRNEGRTIYNCLMSALPFVDEVVIGLAGESTDNTTDEIARALKEFPDLAHEVFAVGWEDDFSKARNIVLEKCHSEYFLWIDGDDELVGGDKLRGYIDRYPNVNAFYMGYDYARDEFGNNFCFLIRERLVKRGAGWKWIGAIHEVLSPATQIIGFNVTDALVRHHKPADKHSPTRNLDILYAQLEASEPNPDPRILAYLGSENAGRGNLTEAILHWRRFVKLSGWDEEKYQTQVKIANGYLQMGNVGKALTEAYGAIEIKPDWPDAYLALARAYASEPVKRYDIALEWLKVVAAKPVPQTMLIVNPQEYSYDVSVMIALCYSQLGDWEMALKNYQQAYSFKQEPLIAEQIVSLQREVDAIEVLGAFSKLREFLARHDEWLKVRQLFDVVPHYLQRHSSIDELRERTYAQTAHIDDPQIMVDFYRGNPHWTPMNEETMKEADWLKYPRMAFALSVAERISAKKVVDWGCSDGFISLPLARETGAEVLGYDLDPRCVDLANARATSWAVPARFEVGNVDDHAELESGTADLAIFFEVLEHVIDPEATLDRLEKTADHIAITTPFLAWEQGNIPQWDKLEPKGHLRIFDLDDIERLIAPRGEIHNLYRQPWFGNGWIFADYAVGKKLGSSQSVVIGAQMGAEPWGPQKLQSTGLGGSETAVIKLGEELTNLGRRVTVYCPVDEPGFYNKVRYRDASKFDPQIRSDMYIAWRMPEAADWGINTGRLVLWMHDTDAGDRLTRDRAERFDYIVVLTEWHKQFMLERYPFLDANKLVVFGNGVDLERFSEPVVRSPKKVVYASSPDRGLDIILEHIWPRVVAAVPEAELHIYYGWENFDSAANLPGYEWLREFKRKVTELFVNSKNVIQHGRIPQDRLAREFQSAAIWLYPTYFHETYCITAIEAQLGGAIPITNHLAGLAETVKSGIILEGDVHDSNTQAKYVESVIQVLTNPDEHLHKLVRENAPAQSWAAVAKKFISLEQI